MAYAAARVYPAMIRKLCVIYAADEDDFTAMVTMNAVVIESGIDALVAAASPELLTNIGIDLVNEFGSEFLQEVIGEILGEAAFATGLSFAPIVGAVAGAALDMMVAYTLTWRVGTTVSAYFQAGGYLGSRKETYDAIKPLAPRSFKARRPGTLNSLRTKIRPIRDRQVAYARRLIKQLGRAALVKRGVLGDILGAAGA